MAESKSQTRKKVKIQTQGVFTAFEKQVIASQTTKNTTSQKIALKNHILTTTSGSAAQKDRKCLMMSLSELQQPVSARRNPDQLLSYREFTQGKTLDSSRIISGPSIDARPYPKGFATIQEEDEKSRTRGKSKKFNANLNLTKSAVKKCDQSTIYHTQKSK